MSFVGTVRSRSIQLVTKSLAMWLFLLVIFLVVIEKTGPYILSATALGVLLVSCGGL